MAADKRVTIADIARLAGVSPGAVSFALNGRPGVSEATRQRILDIAEQLHWVPNSAARALVGSRVGVIGLVVERPARSLGTEAFFADLIAGIQSGLSPMGASMQMRVVQGTDEELAAYRTWHGSKQVDGVIVLDPRDDDPRLSLLAELGMPTVVIGGSPSEPGSAPVVWLDDEKAARTMFDYVRALGHSRIAYLAGPENFEHSRQRAAVLRALGEDIDTDVTFTDFSPDTAARETRRLLSSRDRSTAIVYDNDVMAVSGLRVAQEMAVSVPEDVSIASFDDSVIAGLMHPSITCLSRDTYALGDLAARTMLDQLDSEEPIASVPGETPRLTVRESTSPPPVPDRARRG